MKTLVAYFSQTGNTQKVARRIFEEISGEKEITELGKLQDLQGYDLVFIGFPIVKFGAPPEVADFLSKQAPGHKIAIFITHSAGENMPQLPEWIKSSTECAAGAEVKGIFNCQGELAKVVADFMLHSGDAELVIWAKMRPATIGHPDHSRLAAAAAWARDIQGKI
jgi:flavodoxin